MFPSIEDQVDDELAGRLTGHNGTDAAWRHIYDNIADETEKALAAAAAAKATLKQSKEFRATNKDFRIPRAPRPLPCPPPARRLRHGQVLAHGRRQPAAGCARGIGSGGRRVEKARGHRPSRNTIRTCKPA